jgi:hypothetical protein
LNVNRGPVLCSTATLRIGPIRCCIATALNFSSVLKGLCAVLHSPFFHPGTAHVIGAGQDKPAGAHFTTPLQGLADPDRSVEGGHGFGSQSIRKES